MTAPRPARTPLSLITAAAAAAVLTFFAVRPAPAADAPPPATRPAAAPVVVAGSVEAYEQADLYARAAGYVSAVNADIGDAVTAGQVLAVIDQPELEQDLAEAVATATAKRKLVDSAAAAVAQAGELLNVAKQQVVRYQADADLQSATLKRQEALFAGNAATGQSMDDARAKAAIAQADAAIAKAKVAAAEADLKGALAARDVAAAQAEVAAAAVGKVEALRRYLKVAAPFDGTVTRRAVNRGDLAQAGGGGRAAVPLFTVQRVDVVRVRCDIPQAAAAGISTGTAASVRLTAAGGDPIAAAVTRTARALNPETRTMRVEIDLPNPDGKLLPGAYAQVTLTPGTTGKQATTAPAMAAAPTTGPSTK
ncbi:MAG TPA: efflux RND transporter periplasmic adaptor subunit [Humisphaera sp.]